MSGAHEKAEIVLKRKNLSNIVKYTHLVFLRSFFTHVLYRRKLAAKCGIYLPCLVFIWQSVTLHEYISLDDWFLLHFSILSLPDPLRYYNPQYEICEWPYSLFYSLFFFPSFYLLCYSSPSVVAFSFLLYYLLSAE